MIQSFLPIDNSQKPASEEEEARRAYFFYREIETRSRLAVIDQLPFFLPTIPADEPFPDISWKQPHKLLTCALIYCTAIECGGMVVQEWLIDFFFTAMRLADEAGEVPLGKQLIERVGMLTTESLLTKVGEEIAESILAVDQKALAALVRDYGMESQADRFTVLQSSLTLPMDDLWDLLQTLDSTELPGANG